ncbi:MAG: UDP-N-acetylmuramate--L-alanine ligase [Candidatus Marinimicrobia bacterium]|nr:UDP-N-acetylmuramate--L-alanine ligase [Candidatus Neomarinimicrobiota bacterium]
MFRKVKNIHFVGIGGIGMSGIAELLLNQGFEITGSDLSESELITRLQDLGVTVYQGHKAKYVKNCDVLVYSSAVKENNPELIAARERGIPIIKRAEMLGELIAVKDLSIAVGGTHGKTSTTSMIGSVLSIASLDPTLVVGGLVKNIDTNSKLGSGEIIVVEADEFDRSFLALRPTIAIVTNIELEHTDCYSDLPDLQGAFSQFCNAVPFYGVVIAGLDSPGVQGILSNIKRPVITYGFSNQANFRADDIHYHESKTGFTVIYNQQRLGKIALQLPGEHNVLNALAAIALGQEMNLSFDIIKRGLEAYTGVRRRFEIKGIAQGIMVVDDYAHHPTEVAATLQAAQSGWNRRIVAVFQPHLYSRTRDFHREFAAAFLESDILVVSDVFPAREEPIPGVNGNLVAQAARDLGHTQVHYIPDLNNLIEKLVTILKSDDMVITIGAGNIWRYSDTLYQKLAESP